MKITDYEIINHGYDHAQYFQGCGTAFTDFEDVSTGAGDNAKDAYEDAVEQLAMTGYNVDKMPTRPRGINKKDKVPHELSKHEDSEIYFYVSIRVR